MINQQDHKPNFLFSVQPGIKTPNAASVWLVLSSDSIQVCIFHIIQIYIYFQNLICPGVVQVHRNM